MTFVVVQKRHHTRLFANNHHDRNAVDRSGNILPGVFIVVFVLDLLSYAFVVFINVIHTSRITNKQVLLWTPKSVIQPSLISISAATPEYRQDFFAILIFSFHVHVCVFVFGGCWYLKL